MEYIKLAELYKNLESTTKRLGKTHYISELLKKIPKQDLQETILLLEGRLFPAWEEKEMGVASRLVLKAINKATGISTEEIEKTWKKTGDLGIVAEELVNKKKQRTLFSKELTTGKVFFNLRKLPELTGIGAVEKKISLIAELLTSAKPLEARYIIRTVLEELRIGVGAGSIRDAIVWAFFSKKIGFKYSQKENSIDLKDRAEYNKYVDAVQNAYDLTNDLGVVAEKAKELGLNGLRATGIEIGKPIKVMLALKVNNIKDGFERCGKPSQIEQKYDGFRVQAHKEKGKITLFTRRLDNVTKQFPELVKSVKENIKGDSFIIDSECVGFEPKTKKYLPFQNISQRIKRKYDVELMAKKFPVEMNVFDVLYYNGKNLIKEEFKERRKLIEKIVRGSPMRIRLAEKLVSSDVKDVNKFYKSSLKAGNEGVMFKKMDAPYKPGGRVGYMVKLKPTMETLDLVIVKADWGEGKRAKWLSSFTLACIDEEENYLEVGKVGTGIKEKGEEGVSFEQLTEQLKPLITSEKGKEVKVRPKIVVEINYEEIQKSPTYSSGYALRFPRVIRLRTMERTEKDISTLDMIKELYNGQKK